MEQEQASTSNKMEREQVAQLFQQQQEIGKELTDLHGRFGKENRSRRDKLARLLEWRGKFNDTWTRFLDNHDVLKEAYEQLKEEEYFKDNYYGFIKAYYQDGLTRITLQETIQKRKEGLPTIEEEPVVTSELNEQHNDGAIDELNDNEMNDPGFVTTIGQSTPKGSQRNLLNMIEKGDNFLTLVRVLSRKLDEIEQLTSVGMKTRAKIILKDIEKYWEKISMDLDLICPLPSDHGSEYNMAYQQIAQRYYQAIEDVGESTSQNMNTKISDTNQTTQVKLEPLKIPKFRGTYESWPTFSSLFDTLIISNKSLTDIERMQYLKSVVTDEAERAIASLRITNENFEKAWKILTERFDNKQAIIDNQITRVLEMEKVPGNSAHLLRKFHDQSKEYFVLLKNVSGEQMLVHVLKSKLDNFTRSLYQQQVEDKEVGENCEDFFAFLHKRCRVLESMEFKRNVERDERKSKFKPGHSKQEAKSCSCCGKDHVIYFCEKFKAMKVQERSELIKKKAIMCALFTFKS